MTHAHKLLLMILLLAPVSAAAGLSDWLERQLQGRSTGSLDAETVTRGLKEALSKGASYAVDRLGRKDGYLGNQGVRIPMPEHLTRVEKTLRRLGQDRYADDFIVSMNRAAEAAAPKAAELLVDVIRGMSVRDAFDILNGPKDAATKYFRRHTETDLRQRFRPVVTQATDSAGVTRHYKRMVDKSGALQQWVDPKRLDLDGYVTDKALDGLYYMIAQEEARIREDPAARTTELLRRVFSGR